VKCEGAKNALPPRSLKTLTPAGAYAREDFLSLAERAAKIYWDGHGESKDAWIYGGDYRGLLLMPDEDYPRDASHAAAWANAFGEPQDYQTVEPVYIRKAEAQRRLDAGIIKPRG
jgi:tRNA A37 threonylcarbamoyladenosine modification protein TsaB